MRTFGIEEITLDMLVKESQHERVVITRNGEPVALVVGVEGADQEQIELGGNTKFWELVTERRMEKAIGRAELEQRIANRQAQQS
jgi:prevent-host-death family protein